MFNRWIFILSPLLLAASFALPLAALAEVPETKVPVSAAARWSAEGFGGTPSFTKHVVPLFSKVSCSNRSCHGSFQWQGGFRLSMFGYDPELDFKQLATDGGHGLRANAADVEASLALRKPLGKMPHGGEQVFEEGSWQHRVLRQWIAGGAPYAKRKTLDLF